MKSLHAEVGLKVGPMERVYLMRWSPVTSLVLICHQWWQGACCHPLCVPREEAKEMWEKREAEWARERTARDRLMSEVLTGRQQQIQAKLEQNRRAQEESLRHREQLIRNLEEVRESARREKEESKELKSARKQELEAQVAERQLRAWEEDQQEEEEEEEARQAEQFTDALLQQEVKMMAKQGSWPKPYGHPRIAWN